MGLVVGYLGIIDFIIIYADTLFECAHGFVIKGNTCLFQMSFPLGRLWGFVTIFDSCCTSVKNVAKTDIAYSPTPGVAGGNSLAALSVLG